MGAGVEAVEAVEAFPQTVFIVLFYKKGLGGGLHRLHLFFPTFFLLS
jgi:hypothetical protein